MKFWRPATACAACVIGCSSSGAETASDGGAKVVDATTGSDAPSSLDGGSKDAPVADRMLPPDIDAMPPSGAFCALPGSVVYTAQGPMLVPGSDASAPSLAWLTLPTGFCAHYFAKVPTVRQLRFAPDGRLVAASPSSGTTGGGNDGTASIVILPDADHDSVADDTVTYMNQLPSTQGLLFANGYLYFQDGATIRRVPFAAGDVSPSGPIEAVTTIAAPQSSIHWPKVLDVAQDGTLYVTNGGDQGDACLSTDPVRGAIFKVNPDGSNSLVAKGFRNPIAMRCETDHDVCLAAELVLDYSGPAGGREKLLPVRDGDDWGYPCCATRNLPYSNVVYEDTHQTPDCSRVAPESASFVVGHTPFGLDFEPGKWPAPWTHRVFMTLHGEYGTFEGARVVGISLDPSTGLPLFGSDLDGGNAGQMVDFATGWDDGHQDHGRPAPITFAPDGRMFLGDDNLGIIVWIAPVDLKP